PRSDRRRNGSAVSPRGRPEAGVTSEVGDLGDITRTPASLFADVGSRDTTNSGGVVGGDVVGEAIGDPDQHGVVGAADAPGAGHGGRAGIKLGSGNHSTGFLFGDARLKNDHGAARHGTGPEAGRAVDEFDFGDGG